MTGFDNGILVAYGMMSPPCELMEYYQLDLLQLISIFTKYLKNGIFHATSTRLNGFAYGSSQK